MKPRLFVYGTLKRNQYFFEEFLGSTGAQFIANGHTGRGFTLYIDALPNMAVDGDGVGVRGEIYEVDQETLKRIDDLEGHPRIYRRELIEVRDDEGTPIKVWAYLRPKHLFAGRPGVIIDEEYT